MTYAFSRDFFQKINFSDFSDILFPFSNSQNPRIKMAVDEKSYILDRYKDVLDNTYKDIFQSWLALMTMNENTSFTYICVDLSTVNQNDYCLKLASLIKGERKLIVNSLQNAPFCIDQESYTEYEGEKISVIENCIAKMEINHLLSHSNIISISNSNNISIDKSNNSEL